MLLHSGVCFIARKPLFPFTLVHGFLEFIIDALCICNVELLNYEELRKHYITSNYSIYYLEIEIGNI